MKSEVVLSHSNYSNSTSPVWTVEKHTLTGGLSDGVELLDIDNGRMRIVVVPTRGMSIFQAECEELKLGWNSPVKEIVHPKFMELGDRNGLGWLSGFNELLVRCGVEFAGAPGVDGGTMLPLHGRIGNIPADQVSVEFDEQTESIIVKGCIVEAAFKFGRFELWTELSTKVGEPGFHIKDRLTNRSAYEREYQLIYHTNFGPPLLQEGAQFVGAVKSIASIDSYAFHDLKSYDQFLGPTPGFGEQVYGMQLNADSDGNSDVLLKNATGDRGVSLRYNTRALPYFTLWKNTDTLEDGYVTGFEPCTGFPYNRSVCRELGQVPRLGPGENIEFNLSLMALPNGDSVEHAERDIKLLQDERPIEWSDRLANGEQP